MVRTYPEPDDGGNLPRELPPELLELTYQNRLRTIGRELGVGGYRSILILEVTGGFVVRCVQRADRDIRILEFPDEGYPERMIAATEARGQGERRESPSPIAPTGYEDLLRAIGRVMDERHARNLVVAEKQATLLISGDLVPNGNVQPFEAELRPEQIKQILDDAFRRRTGGSGKAGT